MPNPSRETKFSGANADREYIILFFPVQLTTSRIGNLTRLIHTLAVCLCDHTLFAMHGHQTKQKQCSSTYLNRVVIILYTIIVPSNHTVACFVVLEL